MTLASDAPSTAPLPARSLDSVIACPLRLSVMSTAMSFFGPATPRCTPYTRPYRTCAISSSPLTSLSRTPAHEASFDGTIFSVFLVEAQHRGHHDRGAVGQRDEADSNFLLLGLVRTRGPGLAIGSG